MATPQKPWKAEHAKSGRSSCKTCKSPIDKETFRLGKMVQATQFDGFMSMWNQADCILKKAKQIKSLDDVEGIELLRWEHQQKIRKYIEDGGPASASKGSDSSKAASDTAEWSIEISQTSHATCKMCSEKVMKGEVRISSKPEGKGPRGLAWHHAKCFLESFPSTQLEKLPGWASLQDAERSALHSLVRKVPSVAKSVDSGNNKELLLTSAPRARGKRKTDNSSDHKSKAVKIVHDVMLVTENTYLVGSISTTLVGMSMCRFGPVLIRARTDPMVHGQN